MNTKEYVKKRNFNSTSEPRGSKAKGEGSFRFVIQHHFSKKEHYDFRLEHDGVLLSWAVPKGLSLNPKDKRLAVMVENHPISYIDFEGIIPEGNYGAGSVSIFDKGTYEPLFPVDKGLKKGHLKFVLKGQKYKGEWSLIRTDEQNWLLVKGADEFAKTKDRGIPFKSQSPMLATMSDVIPSGKDWIFEIKYDGYRILCFKEGDNVRLVSRNGKDYTGKFSGVVSALKKLGSSFVIDGEIVAFDDEGRSNFSLLQTRIKGGGEVTYVVFDILAIDGEDLRKEKLIDRKARLKESLNSKGCIVISEFVEGGGKECFDFAKQKGLEGIVAKKKDSFYLPQRSKSWLKIKCYHRQEFVVLGYTTTEKNKVLSALIVGYYSGERLVFAGKVGTGFDEEEKKRLTEKLKTLVDDCPIFEKDKLKIDAIWVKPKLVAEIQFAEFTKDKILRQPSYLGLREDKNSKDVVLEE